MQHAQKRQPSISLEGNTIQHSAVSRVGIGIILLLLFSLCCYSVWLRRTTPPFVGRWEGAEGVMTLERDGTGESRIVGNLPEYFEWRRVGEEIQSNDDLGLDPLHATQHVHWDLSADGSTLTLTFPPHTRPPVILQRVEG